MWWRSLAVVGMLMSGLGSAHAAVATSVFDVDLDQKLPSLQELQSKYKPQGDYEWNYPDQLNIGTVFDKTFRLVIGSYGQSETRIKKDYEDDLIALLEKLPKETYQYIGPILHNTVGMSEKILNMPGIKETKNKFPTRIAPELKDIEDLEFLSPNLYILLMPEMWPDYVDSREYKRLPKPVPKVAYDPNYMQKIKTLVPENDYLLGAVQPKVSLSDLRSVEPTKTSPVTSADVKAFARTIAKLNEFGADSKLKLNLYQAGYLIDLWENENVASLEIPSLKEAVNPCQRLAQKIRLLGLESQFVQIVSEEGFDLKGWAYTCDKTIKALRVSQMHSNKLASILAFRKGLYNELWLNGDKSARMQMLVAEAMVEAYVAPIEDVLEVKKNAKLLQDELKKSRYKIITAPIMLDK